MRPALRTSLTAWGRSISKAILVVALASQGCAVGDKYAKPTVDRPIRESTLGSPVVSTAHNPLQARSEDINSSYQVEYLPATGIVSGPVQPASFDESDLPSPPSDPLPAAGPSPAEPIVVFEEGAEEFFALHDAGPARELRKVILPTYKIEPPDILFIQAVQVVPKEPYNLRSGDVLAIQVPGAFEEAPIEGAFTIGPGGRVQLGLRYGSVRVTGMNVTEAQAAIVEHLKAHVKPEFLRLASVGLLQTVGKQQIEGEHLVGPDGTVTLGAYGSVRVVGMTIAQAKKTIEDHLAKTLDDPEISIDVFAFNSKVYYVIIQGAGLGDSVTRLPITGSDTVLDAIANVDGLTEVSSKKIWVARPGLNLHGQYQVLPVNWRGITEFADVSTNYQLMPGDRVILAENKWVAFDTGLAKLLAPIERLMGFSVLGAQTVTRFSGRVLGGGGDQRGLIR